MASVPGVQLLLWAVASTVVSFAAAWWGGVQTPGKGRGEVVAVGAIGTALGVVLPLAIGWVWLLLPFLGLLGVLVSLAVIDIRTLYLPNRILIPGGLLVVVATAVIVVIEGETDRLIDATLGAGGFFAIMALLYRLSRKSLGFGDVRLAFLLGWCTGLFHWTTTISAMVLASLVGALVAGAALIRGASLKSVIPYGPPMMLGAWLALLIT